MQQHHRDMQQHAKDMAQHAKDMEQHKRDMERHAKDMEVFEEIRAELIKDKLADEKDKSLKFRISPKEGLFVNDKKQPDHVFKKYEKILKEKNGIKPGDSYNYNIEITE